MNKFLGCQWSRLSAALLAIGATSTALAATPQVSPLTLSSIETGKAVEAKMSMTLNDQNFECSGKVILGGFSILTCGEQRQAQVEFQTFNENKDAVIAVYQSGNQEGYMFLAKPSELTYVADTQLAIITPGFGSVKLFSKYIFEPMKAAMVPESQIFTIIPQMSKDLGAEFKFANLRDKVSNREYSNLIVKEEITESSVTTEEAPKVLRSENKEEKEPVKTETPEQKPNSTQTVDSDEVSAPAPVEALADPNEIIVGQDKVQSDRTVERSRTKVERNKKKPKKRLSKKERERRKKISEERRSRAYQRQRNEQRQWELENTPTFQSESDDLFGIPDWE